MKIFNIALTVCILVQNYFAFKNGVPASYVPIFAGWIIILFKELTEE